MIIIPFGGKIVKRKMFGEIFMPIKINIPKYAQVAMKELETNGFEAFVVGGCVRDSIMGKIANDWDMTTSSTPEETLEVFKNFRTIPTGIKHGTITVLIDKQPLEITTFRIDGEYTDNRRPDSVSFTRNIENDLSRRDFTVNAMAYNDTDGIVDLFGGIEDIKNKIIRCVGDPDKRFHEDALRIMRAIRFSATLGFEIEKETAESIKRNKHLLQNIASERIRVELEKLLLGDDAERILIEFSDVIFEIIPELKETLGTEQNCPYHIYDVWQHIVKSVAVSEKNKHVRLAMLLHDIAKPQMKTTDEKGQDHFKGHASVSSDIAYKILKRLKYDNKTISVVTKLIFHHDDRLYNNPQNIKKHASKHGFDFLYLLDKVSRADILAQTPEMIDRISLCDNYLNELKKLEEKNVCLSISDLAVNGNDLMNFGLKGKEIGETLEKLLDKVLKNEIQNSKESLFKFLIKEK